MTPITFKRYRPTGDDPTIIAERIERFNSAAVWRTVPIQQEVFA